MPEPFDDAFVLHVTRQLAEIRKANKITTEQLAERLDTAVQNVRRIEAGQNVTLRTLARVARALGMDVEVALTPRTDAKASGSGRGRAKTK